jgi:hypothetical protein
MKALTFTFVFMIYLLPQVSIGNAPCHVVGKLNFANFWSGGRHGTDALVVILQKYPVAILRN